MSKISITIELSDEEFKPIAKMARYCETTPARIIESILQGQGRQYLEEEGSQIWLFVTEYLREIGEDSELLRRIERYLDACHEHANLPSIQARRDDNHGQFKSLEAFEAWELIDSPEKMCAWLEKYERTLRIF